MKVARGYHGTDIDWQGRSARRFPRRSIGLLEVHANGGITRGRGPPRPRVSSTLSPQLSAVYKDHVRRETIQRVATPTAILVGIPEDLAMLCTDALSDGGLRVLRVGHVAAASERIPVVMPQLVLVSTAFRPEELEMIHDRCVAVGAEVISVAPDGDRAALMQTLRNAANDALIKALRGG